jgi:hypothetical protein
MFTFQRRKAERAQDKAAREDSGGDHDQGRGESSKKPPVRVLLTDLPALVDVYQLTVPGQDDLRPQGQRPQPGRRFFYQEEKGEVSVRQS